MPLGLPATEVMSADAQILSELAHDFFIDQVCNSDSQFLRHIVFGCVNFHFFDQLHPGHQISGGSNAAHAASKNMGNVHAKRITDANLQTIGLTDLDKGF